jgi:hypothetical protein
VILCRSNRVFGTLEHTLNIPVPEQTFNEGNHLGERHPQIIL